MEGAGSLKLCPLRLHAPRSLAGQRILQLVLAGGVLKTGYGGIEGVDTREALARLAGTVPERMALYLLDCAEAGVMNGVALRQSRPAEG